MRGGGSWGRSRLLLDVATSYSDRGTRGVEMMPLRWRGILGSIEPVLAAPPDMGGICESRDWFWLDGGEKRCCWRWASRWLEPTPFISRSSSSWKRTNIVVIHVALPRYCRQEAKESLASPDHLFDGKSNVVKIVDENWNIRNFFRTHLFLREIA